MSRITSKGKFLSFAVSTVLHLIVLWFLIFPPHFKVSGEEEKKRTTFVEIVETPASGRPRQAAMGQVSSEKPAELERQGNGNLKANTADLRPGSALKEKTGENKITKKDSDAAEKSPKLFPTDEQLVQLSKNYEQNPPKGEKGKVLSLNTSELKYQNYLLALKHRIEFYWDYPLTAARNGEQGRLRVDFTIMKDGSVKDIKIIKSSNYALLDDAALTAIRLATPFNPFPENFEVNNVDIHASFEYNLIFNR